MTCTIGSDRFTQYAQNAVQEILAIGHGHPVKRITVSLDGGVVNPRTA